MRQIGWKFTTRWGMVAIVAVGGRFNAMFDDENLGSYHSAAAALDDLTGGHTFTPSCGVDTDAMGLPEDLSEWDKLFA